MKLYCILRDKLTGQWFGLDRAYNLLVKFATYDAYRAIICHKDIETVETDLDFFPSGIDQAPKWAWYVKATMKHAAFEAVWLKPRGVTAAVACHGVAVGAILLRYAGRVEIVGAVDV